jgi:hypothetical protein
MVDSYQAKVSGEAPKSNPGHGSVREGGSERVSPAQTQTQLIPVAGHHPRPGRTPPAAHRTPAAPAHQRARSTQGAGPHRTLTCCLPAAAAARRRPRTQQALLRDHPPALHRCAAALALSGAQGHHDCRGRHRHHYCCCPQRTGVWARLSQACRWRCCGHHLLPLPLSPRHLHRRPKHQSLNSLQKLQKPLQAPPLRCG